MIKVGDTVVREVARPSSLVPKGTSGTVAAINEYVLILNEYPQLVLPVEDFVKA